MRAAIKIAVYQHGVRMNLPEESIAGLLIQRDQPAFEQVFKTYFKSLHAYAYTILKDDAAAEEMVQQVFFKLWERSDQLNVTGSIAAYLYRAVHNESLNHLKHLKVRTKHQLHVAYSMKSEREQTNGEMSKELEAKFREALNDLPEQCRTIFQMSRFEELRYKEIAEKLNLSVKTVENQMGKALKILRVKLVEFLPLLFLFFNL